MTFRVILCVLLIAGCSDGFDSNFAPTGAKGIEDEFGREIYLDEECGGLERPDYPEYFQNALVRDGHVANGRLWMVDGTHLWSAPLMPDAASDSTLRLELPLLGHGNALVASEDFLAVALVEKGVQIFPDYDFAQPISLSEVGDRAIDVDAYEGSLAVAAGNQGILIYDIVDPKLPVLMHTIDPDGYASGVRWDEAGILYFSACRRVGWASFGEGAPAVSLSAPLSHTNAKDAHGNGKRLVAANNGGGVWFFEMLTAMTRSAIYELQDPNFYANAAYVQDEYAYVAAGNREIVALWIYGDYKPEPRAVLPRDPLGIAVNEGVVYGFGNFRDIGERTIVRTRALDGSPSDARKFENGYLSWLEPNTHSIWSIGKDGKEWLTRREIDGYRVYSATVSENTWRPEPAYQFFYSHNEFTVSVTADNQVRVSGVSVTGSTAEGDWSGYRLNPREYFQVELPFLVRYDEGAEVDRLFLDSIQDYVVVLDFPEVQPNHACRFDDGSMNRRGEIENSIEATDIGGAYRDDSDSADWCSRLVDPWIPSNRKAGDHGATARVCEANDCYEVEFKESGVLGILPVDNERWVSLVDDRKSYTTSLVVWHPKQIRHQVLESGRHTDPIALYEARELQRYVRLGRPEGWKLLPDGTVRVWMADGTAFSYDPAANQTFDFVSMEAL